MHRGDSCACFVGIMVEACDTNDEQTVTEATEKIDEGIKLLDDYNNALESLAKEKDMKIEY